MPSKAHIALVEKIRKARSTGVTQRHTVWAFLHGEADTNATPIVVTLELIPNGVWRPGRGRHIPDGPEVPPAVLRGDRVWWGPWGRHYAAALLEAHREAPAAKDELAPVRAWITGDEDGDREIRVLRTFPAPRGYGEGV